MDKNAIIKALRDYAQATSNEVANTVSGPIDLVNAGLGYVGLGTKEPVGGSAWMRRQGLTAPVPEGMAQTLGETTGLILPIVGAAKAPQIATALRGMGENIAKPRGGGMGGGQKGAIVWHGSPHKFDKFDASKIGTGEGAQAYGHGLYLAESPTVATGYKDKLQGGVLGEKTSGFLESRLAKSNPDLFSTAIKPQVLDTISANAGKSPEDMQTALNRLANNFERQGFDWQLAAAPNVRELAKNKQLLSDVSDEIAGSLYKVDLPDEHIAKMLDWDKPLSQQSKNVQQALNSKPMQDAINKLKQTGELANYSPDDMLKLRGEDYYDFMRHAHGESNVVPSEFLRQQGIPGIRYLDGGSRGTGSGTSNFVVFPGNEGILNILERNGAPVSPQNLVKALRNGN